MDGTDIKNFRKINKLSQKDLAAIFNCNQSFISQLENNERPIPNDFISTLLALGSYDVSMFAKDNDSKKVKEATIDQSVAALINMMQQLIDNNQIIAESNKILAQNNSKTVDSLNLISQSNKSLADSTSQTAKSFESISESNLKLTETNQLLVKSNSDLVSKLKAGRMDVQDAECADVG